MTDNTNPHLVEFQYEKQIVTRTRYETKHLICDIASSEKVNHANHL